MISVRDHLKQLALATSQAALEAVKSGVLQRRKEEYTVREVIIIGKGARRWTGHSRKETREVWNIDVIDQIADTMKKRLESQWEGCAQELTTPKKDTPTIRGDLGLLRLAIIRTVADELSAESVPKLVDRLLAEYEGGELAWDGKLYLSGIVVSEPVEVKRGLTLRPATGKDLSSEVPTRYLESAWSSFDLPEIPDSILEVSRSSCSRPDLRRELIALCLFRLGAVELAEETWRCDSILPYKGSSNRFRSNYNPSFIYRLTKEEGPTLAAFLENLPHDLPPKPIGHQDDRRWIGLKNYFRALHTATDDEERLGQAVASLEASLLSGLKGKGELSYRLRLRTASLLRYAGFTPSEIFTDMRTAYDLRSRYAHGDRIGTSDLERARQLCPKVMNYARLAVVKMLQIPLQEEREELLKKLDLALVDENERQNLESRIRGGLWDYAIGLDR